ncbi:MAG: aldo/keto reductase [Bacillota bacterium]|nr:aldo/keto reductase [Bacillota bacterium]
MKVKDKREAVAATSINEERVAAGFKRLTDSYVLNNGVEIPAVGFGTWQIADGDDAYNSVRVALETGYRHIDTAAGYGNEESVGRAIADSGIAREEIFVTTKLRNSDRGYEVTKAAFEESMGKLGLDYLDLWLIHWPNPITSRANWAEANAESWRAFEEFYEAGRLRALGISNFRPHHIEALLKTARVVPQVNQIRICPGDIHVETHEFCRRQNILLEAYSPLGTGKIGEIELLDTIGKKYGKTAAQIALIWSLQRGFLPLPKSVTPSRIRENADIFDVRLTAEEMEQINALDGVIGTARDPDTITW